MSLTAMFADTCVSTLFTFSTSLNGPVRQSTGTSHRQEFLPLSDQLLGPFPNLPLPLPECIHLLPNPCLLLQGCECVWGR